MTRKEEVIMRVQPKYILILWIALMSIPQGNCMTTGESKVDYYNSSCTSGCTCGIIRSNHLHEDLKTFDCSFASMKKFPDMLPKDLQVLSLRGNSIPNVLESISQLTDLRELDLSGNRVKSLGRAGMFQNMTRMNYLNIGKNAVSTIFHDSLKGPRGLEHLILSNNKINYIEGEALIDLVSLKTLDLEHNLLGSLYEEWFHGLENLVALNLAHNRIHNIPSSVFRVLISLQRLHLPGNRISTVDPRAFSGLVSLQILKMEDNLLSRVPTTAFQSLPSLETLTLDQNPLIKLKPLDFSHLSIIKISLCQMPELTIIDAKAFYSLDNVSYIHITDNKKLTYVDPRSFKDVDSLIELKLHNNNIQGLQKEMLKFLPIGTQLSLYDNPFHCDCNIRWLHKLIRERDAANITITDPEHLVCKSPPRFSHKLLKDIDVNKISKVCVPNVLNLTQTETMIGKIGEKKILECRALGSPIPSLYWILPDGSYVNSTLNEVRRRFFSPGTLIYYHLEPKDGGQYTCLAKNSIGKSNGTVMLNVTGIDIHLFPIRVSSTFVTLVWNGTERRAFPSYKITVAETDANGTELEKLETRSASSLRKRFTISRLQPETHYKFCIGYKDNSNYWLQLSCCFTKTQDIAFMLQGISRTSNVAVAAVVGIILVMTVVVCLVSVLSKKYRHRFYETPDKSMDGSVIQLDNLYRPLLMGS